MGRARQDTTTRYAPTREAQEACHGNVGCDFLHGPLRQCPVGQSTSKKFYKTSIQPSKHSIAKHGKALAAIRDRMKATTRDDVLRMRNPHIAGWGAYGTTAVSSHAFQRLDTLLWHRRDRWATRQHSRKSADWVVKHSVTPDGKSTHGSVTGQTQTLRWHSNTPVTRHVTLRKGVSPCDGNWSSWGTRRGKDLGLESTRGKLLKQQGGRCTHCRLFFPVDDTIDIHHADGNHTNRKCTNLRLWHLICHDLAHGSGQTSTMNLSTARRTHDKSDITEEPCASKEASTVLETSREG